MLLDENISYVIGFGVLFLLCLLGIAVLLNEMFRGGD